MYLKIEVTMNLALLVIGDLGSAGSISLKSILALKPNKIYILANESGRLWLKTNFDLKTDVFYIIDAKLIASGNHRPVLALRDYSQYRTQNFDILTALKWDLLHYIFENFPSVNEVLFSDLDIFWTNYPEKESLEVEFLHLKSQTVPEYKRKNWFCTGVMYWFRQDNTLSILKELSRLQTEKFLGGESMNDEVLFNSFYNSLGIRVDSLQQDEYLNGVDIFKLLISNRKRFLKIKCYHANYVTGLDNKFFLLNLVKSKLLYNSYTIVLVLKYFFFATKLKISRSLNFI